MGRENENQPLVITGETMGVSDRRPFQGVNESMLRCNECGAHTNKRGGPFTAVSLKQHMIKAHLTASNQAQAVCDICGLTASNNGKPFSASTLLMHRAKAHPGTNPVASTDSTLVLQCDICGATGNRSGQAFRDQKEVLRHQRAAHGRVDLGQPEKSPRNGSNGGFPSRRVARFCPDCGCNLEVINAALALSLGEGI